jgi:hypothetical protein
MALMVIESKNSESLEYIIVKEEWFEQVAPFELYDYGQLEGPNLENASPIYSKEQTDRIEFLEKEISNSEDDTDDLEEELENIKNSPASWHSDEKVLAYTYHDGHNFRSVTLGLTPWGSADFDFVDSETETEILEAFEEKEFESETTGMRYYKSGKFKFTQSWWQGDWAIATVELTQ